ncbi:MAG: hypothetical protein ACOVP1_09990 [Bacteroidia bacterium]
MRKLLLIICLFGAIATQASDYYEFNKRLLLAQEEISKLKLQSAKAIIINEIKHNPNNLANEYYLNYIECYQVLIGQDKKDYITYKSKVEERIERFENWNSISPEKQIALTQFHLQEGFTKILFNEYIGAALSFRTAFKTCKTLYEKEPKNLTNQKNYGLLYSAIGTFPEQYKWVLRSIGLEGNFKSGLDILANFIDLAESKNELKVEYAEALFGYSYLMLNFGKSKKETWDFIKRHTPNYSDNLAQTYLRALTAEKCYQSEECIKVINRKPNGNDYEQINLLDYLLGSAKLNLLEMDADIWLKKYVSFASSSFLKKEAYRKLSWHALLNGNKEKFKIYRQLSIKYHSNSIEEQIITKDLESNIFPNKNLIKARLYFDGGLFKKSIQCCLAIQANELLSSYQKIELEYRLGRNFQELELDAQARFHLKKCLEIPNPPSTYLVPNACLQLAYIFEKNGDLSSAKSYLQKVFTYKNYEYKQSIYQEAKNSLLNLK